MTSSRSWIVQTLQSTLDDLNGIGDGSVVSVHQAEALEWKVELVYRDMLAKELSGELDTQEQRALPLITEIYSLFRDIVQSIELLSPCQAPQLLDGSVGRPRFSISSSQL